MRAARYHGREDIRIEEIPEPPCGPNQVKIAPAFVGICGSDLHEYLGGPNFCPASRHPVTGDSIPVTLGHEFSGVIKEIGPEVAAAHLRVGLPCAVQPTVYCGTCAACDAGAENACHNGGFIGLSGGGGGLSDAVCVPADQVFPLPEGVPLDLGALVEPLAVAWHAVAAAAPAVTPESTVLVMGGGPIGLAAVLCLVAKGVKNIIVAEIATARRRFAKEFGAAHIINPKEHDVLGETMGITGGVGADVVFDCAGSPASVKAACEAVKTRGIVVNVAIWEKEIPFNPNWLTKRESSYKSVLGYQKADYEAVIENLRTGALKPASMITRKIPLDDLIEHGIKALVTDKDNQVKILVDLNASSFEKAML
ncbi:putative diacetyl reductase [(R)-acetoin forming] 2 [Colletotrichum tanaceti]|uniref:Putative diacetyl reductase [(R)-acetoin forming] 2 n=1 Tax=Colletotrichum tanaceti TaxID=1306861 RepID=A0A4V6DH93_9PEZI|nr:putative diacetyl reductase [(R)-acetoin forming] 2 [Colletotrichum tanaceti]TKW55786.1 putative diacetyl reductase [(R)-acetoin forming] 2 [Colletotrichum tanaceti]